MLRKLAIAVVAIAVLVVVVGLLLPRRWHVEQSVVINATPARIHPFISNLRSWQEWASWSKELDPQVRNSYEGPADGTGAKWSWLGPKMGHGRMEIAMADPRVGVEINEAIESESINAHSSFVYRSEGAGTRVTWVDEGTLPVMLGGYFRSSVERQLGTYFQQGLDSLKQRVEALPPEAAPDPGRVRPDAGLP